ncbi:MAG TPA: hypothetical protein PKM57_07910 [Kiritimatiellia bacterium]|nr:hypothetical protein [Kiritimatiellia bacterium]HPS07584.1 hypothetical protein [Kiritimatiellia bacterium]
MNSLWDQHECVVGQVYTCAVAQLRLWLARNSQGWQVAARHVAESVFEPLHETAEEPEWLEWQRFVTPSASSTVHLVPVLPDRPVVSRPEARIEIAPRHKGRFFVTIPVWLRVQVNQPSPVTVCEFPTRVLSKTWFGHPSEPGEIAYALTTRARQELHELTDVEGRAICPLLLENDTHEALVFAQLLLSVRHMSVYQAEDGKLWTNECRLGYTGSIFPASLTFGRTAPEPATHSRLVSGSRETPAYGLTARVIANAIFKPQF